MCKKKYTKFFNSQITFLIYFDERLYNIKLFRDGTFLLTGYRYVDNIILFKIIDILIEYVSSNITSNNSVTLLYCKKILENYKCIYQDKISLLHLYKIIYDIKLNHLKVSKGEYFINALDIFPIYVNKDIWNDKKEIIKNNYENNIDNNSYTNIFYIKYLVLNEDKGGRIIIKMETKYNNIVVDSTLKIFHSGKINIDGKHNIFIAEMYKEWLAMLLHDPMTQ